MPVTYIVRYMDRFGELDIKSLKDHLENDLLDNNPSPWPTLEIEYNEQSDGLILLHNNYILSREIFYALVAEVEKFYSHFDDKTIKNYNNRAREERYPQETPPPQPKPPRDFSGPFAKNFIPTHLNPRDCEPGYVYLMQDLDNRGIYKIGLARDVERRKYQIGRVEIAHTITADNMAQAEADLQSIFESQRLTGEWFRLYDPDIEFVTSLSEYRDNKFVSKGANNV